MGSLRVGYLHRLLLRNAMMSPIAAAAKHRTSSVPICWVLGEYQPTCQHQGHVHHFDGMTNSPHFFQYTNLNNTKNQHLITCDFWEETNSHHLRPTKAFVVIIFSCRTDLHAC